MSLKLLPRRPHAALLSLASAVALVGLTTGAFAADYKKPTAVVELFQSQGCSSCPPANANVIALSDRPDLLTLSLGVTYWDDLGWKDTFASPQNTKRQYCLQARHRPGRWHRRKRRDGRSGQERCRQGRCLARPL